MYPQDMSAVRTSDKSRIVASRDQVSCDLSGEAALLSLKTGVYYGLNPVGARILSLIQTTRRSDRCATRCSARTTWSDSHWSPTFAAFWYSSPSKGS
jgi:hypothetical protein